MKIKGMVFDLDGTLLDTEPIAIEATNRVAPLFGIEVSIEKSYEFLGISSDVVKKYFLDNFGSDFDYEGYRRKKIDYQKDVINRDGIKYKKGAKEILEFAKENNIKCAVATSTGRERADFLIEKAQIGSYFSAIVCGSEVENGKPAPDVFIEAVRRMGVSTDESIGFEDSRNGIISSHRAGLLSILIPDLLKPDNDSLSAADHVFNDMAEALSYVRSIYEP